MNDTQFAELSRWITEAGLAGRSEIAMLDGFCGRLQAAGMPLAFAVVIADTLHPVHEGHAIRWYRDKPETTIVEYGPSNEGQAAENWRRSIFYRLFDTNEPFIRRRLTDEAEAEFPGLKANREEGMTDYVAIMNRFAAEGVIGEADCIFSAWTTDKPEGFSDADLVDLQRLAPFLAIAVKCATLAGIAQTLVQTYLGRDAGARVLAGRIGRGVGEKIDAVLWFSDLRGYTRISDTAEPEQIIPLLNDYAEAIISAVTEQGGDVLKLIGDGVLAIFRASDRQQACRSAIAAAAGTRTAMLALNEERAAQGLPTTHIYLGLHVGEVLFGNIGSKNRLDFTVVGPAVNEVSRIAALCRSVEQKVLISSAFAAALGASGPRLASVGRFALRGVSQAQDLYTIDPVQPAITP
ncbi:MAG TPA: adenylate/guanylate cyclase domain-containing protein [Dongiaceae bacterium]|jgi:adenylate cyclase|nr:adenylate/guanylate cyclase domain-containing protein [Dongiaceae bacterium]